MEVVLVSARPRSGSGEYPICASPYYSSQLWPVLVFLPSFRFNISTGGDKSMNGKVGGAKFMCFQILSLIDTHEKNESMFLKTFRQCSNWFTKKTFFACNKKNWLRRSVATHPLAKVRSAFSLPLFYSGSNTEYSTVLCTTWGTPTDVALRTFAIPSSRFCRRVFRTKELPSV